jgi:iron complex outermembrane receptor protein
VGHPPTDFGLLSATASLAGDALLTRIRGQIGETLASLPGVSSTAFAPGASRPVLRGFSGDRVSVMIDGIGSLDASNISVDHAVVFDPLTIDHVDVFHGPSVLLYGGNAIPGHCRLAALRPPAAPPGGRVRTRSGNQRSIRRIHGLLGVARAMGPALLAVRV